MIITIRQRVDEAGRLVTVMSLDPQRRHSLWEQIDDQLEACPESLWEEMGKLIWDRLAAIGLVLKKQLQTKLNDAAN